MVILNAIRMLRYILLIQMICSANSLWAQGYNGFLNKRFQVVHQQKNTTTLLVQGEPLLFYSERTIHSDYAVAKANGNSCGLSVKTSRVTGKLIAYGREQAFDSNDRSSLPVDDSLAISSLLNKVLDMQIGSQEQQLQNKDTGNHFLLIQPEDIAKFFLILPAVALKNGYSWTDSTVSGNGKTVNEYMVTKTTGDSLEVAVFSLMEQQVNILQNQQSVIQKLKGYSRATRWYDLHSRLLKHEEISTSYNGSSAMNDQLIPVGIKINSTTQLKELR